MTPNTKRLLTALSIFIFFTLVTKSVEAQTTKPLSGWKYFTDYTVAFQITEKEAENLLKGNLDYGNINSLLNTPVASFKGKWEDTPKQGHFLYGNVQQDMVHFSYNPIIPFQVFLFKEYGRLTLQVIDANGEVRDNADVSIHGRWRLQNADVPYNKDSQTYTIEDDSEKEERILSVKLDGFKMLFDLKKRIVKPQYNNSNGERGGSAHRPDFYSYMVTDKNKYKPNENIKFKSYALATDKKAITTDLSLWLRTARDNYSFKKIATISPYNAGGFSGEFNLHDSLGLKLDQQYTIQLRDNRGRIVANTSFTYEDYDLLKKENLKIEVPKNHYSPQNNELKIKLTDDNGLPILGATATVSVIKQQPIKYYVPLYTSQKWIGIANDVPLSSTKEPTTISIPANVMGAADLAYILSINIRTADGRNIQKEETVNYYYSHDIVTHKIVRDSIRFDYTIAGESQNVKAEMKRGNFGKTEIVDLPYQIPFNQYIDTYNFKLEGEEKQRKVELSNIPSQIDLEGNIRSDLFKVELINPMKINLSWFIYEGSTLLEKGSGTEFKFEKDYPETDNTHFVEIFYTMGGKEKVFRKTFVPQDNALHIDLDMTNRVYPGQTVDATITVRDQWNRPVKGVDLTAFAVTNMLEYATPDLPDYSVIPIGREERSSYSIQKKDYIFSRSLDNVWSNVAKYAKIDEEPYYQFQYPKGKLFKASLKLGDKTEFAPFVMERGRAKHIYAVECNGKPIFLAWLHDSNTPNLYEISDSTEQQITLVMADRVLTLEPMMFEKGMKTILSLDMNSLPSSVKEELLDIGHGGRIREFFRDRYKDYVVEYIIPQKYFNKTLTINGENLGVLKSYTKSKELRIIKKEGLPIGNATLGDIEFYNEGGYSYDFTKDEYTKTPLKSHADDIAFGYNSIHIPVPYLGLTKSKVDKKEKEKVVDDSKGIYCTDISVNSSSLSTCILLPNDKDANLLDLYFENEADGKISKLHSNKYKIYVGEDQFRMYDDLNGLYTITAYYHDGYVRQKNVPLEQNMLTYVDMRNIEKLPGDSVWHHWIDHKTTFDLTQVGEVKVLEPYKERTYTTSDKTKVTDGVTYGERIMGIIFDEYNEPLVGVAVSIKGTTIGTLTDLDGEFALRIPDGEQTLLFSYIGFNSQEVKVKRGAKVNVVMEESPYLLEEVVVMAYGSIRKSNTVGSMSTYQEEPSTSIPQEDVEDSEAELIDTEAEDRLYMELMKLNGLRTNFSDVAFWQPALVTDKKGKAKFSVTFPDDITRWESTVYAMNDKLKTGTLRKSIKSYKPLMAELDAPNFMVVGDSCNFIGTVRNYTQDAKIEGNLLMVQNSDTLFNNTIAMESYRRDTPTIVAYDTDSLSASYLFTRSDGYQDGEKRTIPIMPVGILAYRSDSKTIVPGDSITIAADADENVEANMTVSSIDVFMQSINYLIGYEHACNEQLSSKLMGILNYKIYQDFKGEAFEDEKAVMLILNRLKGNQNDAGLWSWWNKKDEVAHWMTAQVIRAIGMANAAGYESDINLNRIIETYFGEKSNVGTLAEKIDILQAIAQWGRNPRLVELAKKIEAEHNDLTLLSRLKLYEIRAINGDEEGAAFVSEMLKKDDKGGLYMEGDWRHRQTSSLIVTLAAYRVAKYIPSMNSERLGIIHHLLTEDTRYLNTYESAQMISTVFKDLTNSKGEDVSNLEITHLDGNTTNIKTVRSKMSIVGVDSIRIQNKGISPAVVSITSNKIERRTAAIETEKFKIGISTSNVMEVNKVQEISVRVTVKEKAKCEYVVIEIPIPAGCIHDPVARKKHHKENNEVHREYFKDRVAIYCNKLPEGTYYFRAYVLPKYAGVYTLNPTRIEEMYVPGVKANSDTMTIRIEDTK